MLERFAFGPIMYRIIFELTRDHRLENFSTFHFFNSRIHAQNNRKKPTFQTFKMHRLLSTKSFQRNPLSKELISSANFSLPPLLIAPSKCSKVSNHVKLFLQCDSTTVYDQNKIRRCGLSKNAKLEFR